ncbi:hypothetical protein C497_06544 [Halalkalicoccus jeotgali B3]|uniref:Uncharacterized protein n=1 Tax=Halalkalicoccus jeotgali (strain DSM 18796 / CECT 7217 / JCM 14584 / KCTC 4019 / B3) TaxID=795797 RepID=D8JCB0_HALJB|nr:hypothetical protein HacjB3_18373 [Halalkalicoccus jeotgali B3]ELY38820.1 hypothetical protein C497_06544 [Halalkalicoccus jeotgali B3]
MNRNLPLAVFCGLLIGFGIYWFLSPDWFVASGTAAVYAGAAYFYFKFDISLLDSAVQFDDRIDRLGYAIGLFGLCVSPMAFAQYYGQQGTTTIPFVILFMGVIAFLLLISKAQQQTKHIH